MSKRQNFGETYVNLFRERVGFCVKARDDTTGFYQLHTMIMSDLNSAGEAANTQQYKCMVQNQTHRKLSSHTASA